MWEKKEKDRKTYFIDTLGFTTAEYDMLDDALIDADLYVLLSSASNQGNIVLVNYYLDLINNEQYHFDEIKTRYPDTYNFLKSLEYCRLTMGLYT